MTPLDEIKSMTSATINADKAAKVLGVDPHSLRVTARTKPEMLGFPVTVIGSRVKIPRLSFIQHMCGGGS